MKINIIPIMIASFLCVISHTEGLNTFCGPFCLKAICDNLNKICDIEQLIILTGYDPQDGTTMLGLLSAAEKLGLPAVAVKMTDKQLGRLSDPAILLVDENHYLIAHKARWFGKYLLIEDPPKEKETVPIGDILNRWNGEAILFSEKVYHELANTKEAKPPRFHAGPHIVVDDQVLFLGTVKEGEQVKASFTYQNTGTDTLRVSARPSCGCISGHPGEPHLPPRERGSLEVVFDSTGRAGHQHQSVTLVTNDPESHYIRLIVALTVQR